MNFKEGDVIVIIKSDNHFGEEGIIERSYKSEFSEVAGKRWVVVIPNHPTNTKFIIKDEDMLLSVQYERDKKIKSLGIE